MNFFILYMYLEREVQRGKNINIIINFQIIYTHYNYLVSIINFL